MPAKRESKQVKREIILHTTLNIHGKFVKLVEYGGKAVFTEDVETKGDTVKKDTGLAPMENFVDWYAIKHYGINLN